MWIGDKDYKCSRWMIGYPTVHLCNRPALVKDFDTGGYFCQSCYNRLISLPNVTEYPTLDFIKANETVKIPFRGTPMAKCPNCGRDTLHPFKSKDDRTIIAKCNKCGLYRHKEVKLSIAEYKKIIQSLLRRGLTIEEIAKKTGEPLERLKDATI